MPMVDIAQPVAFPSRRSTRIAEAATLPKDVASIQYLRGIAATMVVFAHANEQFMAGGHQVWRDIGWSGVDIFFAISGFIMTYTVARDDFSRATFLKKRVARIVPMYWATTIAAATLVLLWPGLFQTTHFGLSNFIQSLLFIFSRDPIDGKLSPTLHLGWTLNFEMFFYLCFVATLFIKPLARTAFLAAMFLVFITGVSFLRIDIPAITRLADTVTFEFLLGCLIGSAYIYGAVAKTPFRVAVLLAALGIAGLIAGGLLNDNLDQRWFYRGIPAAALIYGLLAIELRRPFRNAFLHATGDASYSIYLTHIFSVEGVKKAWRIIGLPTANGPAYGFVAIAVIAGGLGGWVAWRWIERPLSRRAQELLGLRQKP
jgi:exopolysaccharide production protein ExoZ